MHATRRMITLSACLVLLLLAGPIAAVAVGIAPLGRDWRLATHNVTGIAPDPAIRREAIVQVYGARAFSWRGAFGIHTWFAVKPQGATTFTTYEVIGWRYYHGLPAIRAAERRPDTEWFGNAPVVLAELSGPAAAEAIPEIERAVAAYPYNHDYRVWPGPNSNTFTAYVARAVPALHLDLPPTAVGKDYLADGILAPTPSGTGYQLSVGGVFGLLAGLDEGIEFTVFGLGIGVDPLDLALRLPGLGRVGWRSIGQL
jgi:hypothetical protein